MAFALFGKGRETQALQLYGKLPIAKDYLRIGCADGSARDWREWLDRTFGALREGEEQLVLRQPWRFVLGGKEPLQGILWPSADAGGHRAFPFTLLLERRPKALLADFDAGLSEAEGAWRSLAEIFGECQSYEDGRDLLERQRGRDVQVTPRVATTSAGACFEAWGDALWPQGRIDGLHRVLEDIRGLVRGGYSGPFRLPLVRELPIRDQVLGWKSVLHGLGALGSEILPTMFFPPRALGASFDMAGMVVASRPLSEDQVTWLTASYGEKAVGPGDFCAGYEGREPELEAEPEDAPPLRVALGEALSSFLAGRS